MKPKSHQLSPKERHSLGQLANEVGISAAVRQTGNNPRTVRLWRERVRNGAPLQSRNAQLSSAETAWLLQHAPRTRNETLAQCRKRAGSKRSRATLSRLYRTANIVMPEPLLGRYRLHRQRKYLNVILIFYSVPRRLVTPRGPARLIRVNRLPFYTPRQSDYFLYDGKLFSVEQPLFLTAIAPYLIPQADCSAWFINVDPDKKFRPWHVIDVYRNEFPVTYCGQVFTDRGTSRMGDPVIVRESGRPLCRKCLPKVITAYQRNRNLKPRVIHATEADPEIALHWITQDAGAGNQFANQTSAGTGIQPGARVVRLEVHPAIPDKPHQTETSS